MLEHHQQQVLSLAGGGGGVSGPVGVAGYYNQPGGADFVSCGGGVGSPAVGGGNPALNLNELGEANLLEMLQVLTRRRDELRQMDKQLFDLMAECCVRLKPAADELGAQQAIDLSPRLASVKAVKESDDDDDNDEGHENRARDQDASANGNGKRKGCAGPEQQQQGAAAAAAAGANGNSQSRYSPSLHIKKMRLLSGIVSQDDIGEKQQVLAEKELDVREGSNDDEKLVSESEKQTICSNSTSSFSSSSSSLLLSISPSVKHAYQQQAINDHRQQQQHQATNQVNHLHASNAICYQDENENGNQEHDDDIDDDKLGEKNKDKLFDTGSSSSGHSTSSATSHSDGLATDTSNGNFRPKLQKFYSIGTAEMSFERSLRQQHLIDSTLATLVQQQQQQQHSNNMLVPIREQREQAGNCFALSPPVTAAYGKRQVAMLSPLIHFQHQPVVPHQQQQQQQVVPSSIHHHFGLACPQSVAAGSGPLPALGPPAPPVPSEQQLVYSMQQKISPFDRMLATHAKDLGPIVRKMSFRCHVCSSCFEDRHRLQQHLSIHLNLHASWFEERVIKKTMAQYELRRGDYLCQVCQLRYETTAEFDKHMHLHGEKPHQCELCQQDNKFVSFRYFRQLLTHLRSHCFEFTCRFVPECRHIANRKDYLKLHILKHHLNNKLPEQLTICCH